MAIEFLKADNNKQFVRPKGRTFPVGLSTFTVTTNATVSVDYLVVAGGGSGGADRGGGGRLGASPAPYRGNALANSGGGALDAAPGTGNGGKGVVIIRYAGAQVAGGGTVDTSGVPGFTTHIFTGDGTFSANNLYAIN